MNEQNMPLYQQIYDYIYDEIVSEKIKIGERLMSEKELAQKFNVSNITSKKALEMLAEKGMIKRIPGKGSFVIFDKDEPGAIAAETSVGPNSPTLIGVVIPDFSESYGMYLISGIEEETSKNKCYLVLRRTYGKQSIEEEMIDSLMDLGVDGLIIMPVHGENYNPKILRLLIDGFPVVLIDRNLRKIPSSLVGTDNINASKMATDYLLNLGHRYISFLSPNSVDTSTIEDRVKGFLLSHESYGLTVDKSIWLTNIVSTIPGNNQKGASEEDVRNICDLIKKNPRITCLFAVEYNISLLALEAVKRLNLKVPEDISIICFDGPKNYIGNYFFTHVRQNEEKMGKLAIKLIIDHIHGKEENEKVLLEAELVIGRSTGKVPK